MTLLRMLCNFQRKCFFQRSVPKTIATSTVQIQSCAFSTQKTNEANLPNAVNFESCNSYLQHVFKEKKDGEFSAKDWRFIHSEIVDTLQAFDNNERAPWAEEKKSRFLDREAEADFDDEMEQKILGGLRKK